MEVNFQYCQHTSINGQPARFATPLSNTAWNFIATLPLVLLTALFFLPQATLSLAGIMLAILSGAFASGIGYAIWYRALPHLAPTHAATVQLSVPVIAAFGGVMLMVEPVSLRLIILGIGVLGGIYLTIRPVKTVAQQS